VGIPPDATKHQNMFPLELKKEKDNLLRILVRPPAIVEQKTIPDLSYKASSGYYSPIELYTQHPDSHSDRQKFR
jgi:hypothetical protein